MKQIGKLQSAIRLLLLGDRANRAKKFLMKDIVTHSHDRCHMCVYVENHFNCDNDITEELDHIGS